MWSRIAVFVLGQKYSYAKEFKLMNQSFHAQPALTKGFKKKTVNLEFHLKFQQFPKYSGQKLANTILINFDQF